VLKHMHHPRRKAWLGRVPCHVAHWKAGHKEECKRLSAEADTAAATKADRGAKGSPGVPNEKPDSKQTPPRESKMEGRGAHRESAE
jgi:hypothetical protein